MRAPLERIDHEKHERTRTFSFAAPANLAPFVFFVFVRG
jgi:hypothetical protein